MTSAPAPAPSTIEDTTIRKLRTHVIPFVFVLFVINFVDRINSIGNLGGCVGPYAMGAINKRTGSFHGGLAFAGISLFTSAMLILAFRKRITPETRAVAMTGASPAVFPPADVG